MVAALRELALEAAANALRLVDPPADKLPKHVVFRDDPDTVVKADPLAFLNEAEEMTATPLFRVEVAFVDSELQLSPSKEAMQLCFNDVLQSCLRVVGIPDRIFRAPRFGVVRDDGRRRTRLERCLHPSHAWGSCFVAVSARERGRGDVVDAGSPPRRRRRDGVRVAPSAQASMETVLRGTGLACCSQDIADALSRTFDETAAYCEVFQPYAGKGSVSVENDAFLADIRQPWRSGGPASV